MIGAVLTSAAFHLGMLVTGRVILGFGVGLATQSVPVYLSEMAPTHIRGTLNIMFQLSITIGILIAELINLGEPHCPKCLQELPTMDLTSCQKPLLLLWKHGVFRGDADCS